MKSKQEATRRSTRIKIKINRSTVSAPQQRKPVVRRSCPSKNPTTYEGVPQAALPEGYGWPVGWKERRFQRQTGNTAGSEDIYFYPPKSQSKLRSIVQVVNYIEAFNETRDAKMAMKRAKELSKRKKHTEESAEEETMEEELAMAASTVMSTII